MGARRSSLREMKNVQATPIATSKDSPWVPHPLRFSKGAGFEFI
jgi:hypothetical protein